MKLSGGCICGELRFSCNGAPSRVTLCHCLWCQRRTGTAFGAEAVYLRENVTITGSCEKVHRHVSDESHRWLDMHFCDCCGTNIGLTLEIKPEIRSLPVGAFDDPSWFEESKELEIRHVYMRSRRDWVDPNKALCVYRGYFE